MKKNAVCHSFGNVDACETIEKIVETCFYDTIHATRKWRVRQRAFALILFHVFQHIAHNYNAIKKTSFNIKNETTRYSEYAKANALFTVSKDNNKKALMYGENKVGVRALKAVFSFFEEKNWMSHENGFCCHNENGVSPYKLGIEYIDFNLFLDLYKKYFNELNELFGVIVEKVEDGIETVRACVSKSMKPVCGFIFGKATNTPTPPTSPLSNILKMIFNRLNSWTGLRLAA